jgi:hypothetical protein
VCPWFEPGRGAKSFSKLRNTDLVETGAWDTGGTLLFSARVVLQISPSEISHQPIANRPKFVLYKMRFPYYTESIGIDFVTGALACLQQKTLYK